MKTLFAVTLLLCFIATSMSAQNDATAPSLQVGLGGLNFSRGNLDAELIAELVAEKQQQIKTRLIKNMFLNNIGVDNGLFYSYIDNTIDIITTEKNEETRVKNLIENTVNLSFVLAYTEYYLHTLRYGSEELNNIRMLAFSYGIDTTLIRPGVSLKEIAQIRYRNSDEKGIYKADDEKAVTMRNEFIGVLIDLFAEVIRTNEELKTLGLMRTNYLQNAAILNAYLQLDESSAELVQSKKLKDAYTKLVSALSIKGGHAEEIREIQSIREFISAELKRDSLVYLSDPVKKKFFDEKITPYIAELKVLYKNFETALGTDSVNLNTKIPYFLNENYRTASIASGGGDKHIQSIIGFSPRAVFSGNDDDLKKLVSPVQWYYDYTYKLSLYHDVFRKRVIADRIFENVTKNLSIHLKYVGLIKSLSARGTNFKSALDVLSRNFKCGDQNVRAKDITNLFVKGRAALDSIRLLNEEETKALVTINAFTEKLRFIDLDRYSTIAQFEKEVKLSLEVLGKYSMDFISMRDTITNQLFCIGSEVQSDLKSINIDFGPGFTKLLARLNEFDETETYDLYLNLLSEAGDVFSDEKMRSSINRIISFLRSYISVAKDQNNETTLNIDTEGFIMAIQKVQYPKWRQIQFNFTVGVNNVAFNDGLIMGEDTIRNFSNVSEKIGIKIKLMDWKYARGFNRGEPFSYWGATYKRLAPPREPIVSNFHLLLYGSGLLYNIFDTGTNKNFDAPLAGIGCGLTFYNSLDLNVSWGRPVLSNRKFFSDSVPSYFNVGFDIQFIEYFNKLNEKRKAKKTQKIIEQAKS